MSGSEWPIGCPKEEIDTPALVIDCRRWSAISPAWPQFFADKPAKLRPHAKTHKSPIIAQKQLAAGNAVGITCAKLGEAEVMVEGGIKNILIANQIVGKQKIARLAALARHAEIMVAVDDAANLTDLCDAAQAAGSTLGVLVEVNIGMNRCGVEPGEPALALARFANRCRGLRFMGLQGYEGHLVMLPDPAERRESALAAMQPLVETRRLIERSGPGGEDRLRRGHRHLQRQRRACPAWTRCRPALTSSWTPSTARWASTSSAR